MTSPPDAQAAFSSMMREQVAPRVRELGFRGPVRAFRYTDGGHSGSVRLQKSRYSTKKSVDFTFHIGAPCMGSAVIVSLMPLQEPPVPYWWTVAAGEPTEAVAESVVAAIRTYALPAILAGLQDADHERHPSDVESGDDDAGRPPLPPLVNPDHDGAGADPSSWFVRPSGHVADFAFADLVSHSAATRSGAAETIARLAMADPRAVPALIDRLENDLSPYIRRQVAARMLTPLAGTQPVTSALQAAAASDPDCEVRWAARYALRVGGPPS
jgi:hypothetical protein